MGVLTDTVTLRRATVDDAPTVVHFRSLMFQSMGEDDVSWVPHAEHVLREGIEQGRMVAVVAEESSNGGVYRSLGFAETDNVALRLHL